MKIVLLLASLLAIALALLCNYRGLIIQNQDIYIQNGCVGRYQGR
jgi:hypothetical protein